MSLHTCTAQHIMPNPFYTSTLGSWHNVLNTHVCTVIFGKRIKIKILHHFPHFKKLYCWYWNIISHLLEYIWINYFAARILWEVFFWFDSPFFHGIKPRIYLVWYCFLDFHCYMSQKPIIPGKVRWFHCQVAHIFNWV